MAFRPARQGIVVAAVTGLALVTHDQTSGDAVGASQRAVHLHLVRTRPSRAIAGGVALAKQMQMSVGQFHILSCSHNKPDEVSHDLERVSPPFYWPVKLHHWSALARLYE